MERRAIPLDPNQMNKLKKTAEEGDLLDELIVKGMDATGMRASEFTHMRSTWLNEDDAGDLYIIIPERQECTMGRDGGPCTSCKRYKEGGVWTPKTDNSARTIPITDPEAEELLRAYFRVHDEVGVAVNTVNRRLKKMQERAGIERDRVDAEKILSHDLRATVGTRMVARGVQKEAVRDALGHSVTTTTDRYVNFTPFYLRREIENKVEGTTNSDDDGDGLDPVHPVK